MQIGIDILELKDFEQSIKRTPQLKQKIFHEDEIDGLNELSIAGKFCAKEAAIKAGIINVGEWLKIKVLNQESGKPFIADIQNNVMPNYELSISHTNSIIIAVAVRM